MSNQTTVSTPAAKKKLPIAGQALDLDAEMKKFEEEERKRLGLDGHVDQWVEDMVGLGFKKSERSKVTLLVGGLTVAQDFLI
ncbi:MAG TPA: 2-hydroxyglutaryl-CoA dehydratase, partial [Labilithrix sp.]|nr:2-hydroxyglutaryl-CoA dehydratase [Labilithrix sp.]